MQRVWVQLRADGSRAHGPALRVRLLSPAHPAAAAAAAALNSEASAWPHPSQPPKDGWLARGGGAPSVGAADPESGLVTPGAGRAPAAAESAGPGADTPSRAGARGSADLETMLGWLSLGGDGAAREPRQGPREGLQPAPGAAGAGAGRGAHQALSGPAADARRSPAPEQPADIVPARNGAPGSAGSAAPAAPADQAGARPTAPAGMRAGTLAATHSDDRGVSVAAVLAGLEEGSLGEWGRSAGEDDPGMRSEDNGDQRWRVPQDNPQASL